MESRLQIRRCTWSRSQRICSPISTWHFSNTYVDLVDVTPIPCRVAQIAARANARCVLDIEPYPFDHLTNAHGAKGRYHAIKQRYRFFTVKYRLSTATKMSRQNGLPFQGRFGVVVLGRDAMRSRISASSCISTGSGSPLPQTDGAVHGEAVIAMPNPTESSPAVAGRTRGGRRATADRERCSSESSP